MDRMDELLSQMPSEAPSPDFVVRVQARLRAQRRRARWSVRALRFGALAAGALGAALGWPILRQLAQSLTASPVESFLSWVGLLLDSPLDAVLLAIQEPWEWGWALGSGLEASALLALILLAVAGTYGAIHLITLQDRQEGLAS